MLGFNNTTTVNSIISKVNFRLTVLNEIFKYSNIRTKLMLTNAIIVSVIRYAAPLLICSSNKLISKLQVPLMRYLCLILGFTSYKLSTQKIMGKLNWLTAYQLITKETVLFTNKIVFNNQPQSITNLITFSLYHSQNVRSIRKPIIKEEHNPSKAKNL